MLFGWKLNIDLNISKSPIPVCKRTEPIFTSAPPKSSSTNFTHYVHKTITRKIIVLIFICLKTYFVQHLEVNRLKVQTYGIYIAITDNIQWFKFHSNTILYTRPLAKSMNARIGKSPNYSIPKIIILCERSSIKTLNQDTENRWNILNACTYST